MIKCLFELDVDWILYSLSYSYIKVTSCFIASISPDISEEAIQDPALLHTFLNTFCGSFELSFKKEKERSANAACAASYEAYGKIHVSEAQFACIPSID